MMTGSKGANRCNFCALCPCPNIRADIIKAKTEFIARDGLKFGVRTIEDVERVGKLCGVYPQLTNILFQNKLTGQLLKSAAGIHQERQIPIFPEENFPLWAQKHNLNTQPKKQPNRKIAYFAGCTANYLFPDVPKAVVQVLKHNGFEVYYPEQKCCGMAGIMGFKREFHHASIHLGSRLIHKIKELNPENIVTDCLSCRLQFTQLTPHKVIHPIEILNKAYSDAKGRGNH